VLAAGEEIPDAQALDQVNQTAAAPIALGERHHFHHDLAVVHKGVGKGVQVAGAIFEATRAARA